MLELKNLTVRYGGITAVDGISLTVNDKEAVSLIGANGAGKTTTLHAISALLKPAAGSVVFNGTDITSMQPDKIVQMGIVQVPEGRQVFTKLTVEDNLKMGAYLRKDKEGVKKSMDYAMELFPIIRERRKQLAGTLSGGEQQMRAIARALMTGPKVLLLDEPSMGLSPLMTQEVFKVLRHLKDEGTTIFLIEQNAYEALELTDRAYIMESGRISLEGRSSELLNDERVKNAYLGGDV